MKMTPLEKLFVNSPGYSRQVSYHAEMLLQKVEFKAGQKYLDLGCGNGAAPIYLARKYNLAITGVDIDPAQIRLAQESSQDLPQARFLTVDGTRLPFEANEFDIVATNKVMHHIPNWPAAVLEMIRVLKPEGYFIYSDLVYPRWVAALGQIIAQNGAGFPTRARVESLLKQHSLTKIYVLNLGVNYEVISRKNK
ncbi:MAG: class I SAM-dependent methyltransferase [Anaerolineae bacterium]|nr:class I SAM-dependent methyltransferase [Anaerolineae bacterium]